MKVILKDYVRKLGDVGDVVNVKEGFARNYLLPNDLAIPATENNLKRVENIRKTHQEKHQHLVGGFKDMAERLNGKTITITSKVNEAGRLYGSIGEKEVADTFNQMFSTSIDPKHVEIGGHIKEPGTYKVHMRFTVGVGADVEVTIAPDSTPEPVVEVEKVAETRDDSDSEDEADKK
jgi:large subunit ribosomal protein L9